jgi:hypothetical protein
MSRSHAVVEHNTGRAVYGKTLLILVDPTSMKSALALVEFDV